MTTPCFAQAPRQAPDSALSIWGCEIRAELTLGDSTSHSALRATQQKNRQDELLTEPIWEGGKWIWRLEIVAKLGAAHNSCSQGSALCSRTEPGASKPGRDSSRSQRESSGLGAPSQHPAGTGTCSRDRDLHPAAPKDTAGAGRCHQHCDNW